MRGYNRAGSVLLIARRPARQISRTVSSRHAPHPRRLRRRASRHRRVRVCTREKAPYVGMDYGVLGNYRLTSGLPAIRESARDWSSRNAACDHFSRGFPLRQARIRTRQKCPKEISLNGLSEMMDSFLRSTDSISRDRSAVLELKGSFKKVFVPARPRALLGTLSAGGLADYFVVFRKFRRRTNHLSDIEIGWF